MGGWLKHFGLRSWKTPGGTAYKLYLEMLEQNNLLIVGKEDLSRQQLRDGLLYTLLFQSPLKRQLVLLGESFRPYSKLPHAIGYYTDYKDIYGVLVRVGEIISERIKETDLSNSPVYYVFIEDYATLLAKDDMIAFQVSNIAKYGTAAKIKLVVFSDSFDSPTTILSPNVKVVSPNCVFNGVTYNIPIISQKDCVDRIDWWTGQHKRSVFDWLNKIRPSSTPTAENMTGLEYESYVAQKLKRQGFKNITVTQASGDYGADILATDRKGRKTCIQCKKYVGSVGVHAVQEIIAAKGYYGCQNAMVITTATFTRNAKTLAKSQGVELVEHFL